MKKFTHLIQLFFPFILTLIFSFNSYASVTVETTIANLSAPEKAGESYLLFSSDDGRVYEIESEDLTLINKAISFSKQKKRVKLTVSEGESSFVEAIESTSTKNLTDSITHFAPSSHLGFYSPMGSYSPEEAQTITYNGISPSLVNSFSEAASLFKTLPTNAKWRSQCFRRAHRWANQLYVKNGISSMKIFLFYSKRYIREIDKKWWFHVAPFILVNNGYSFDETVLDPTFTKSPLTIPNWTNNFIENKASCREVSSYDEYERLNNLPNAGNEWCFYRKVSMYYFQPLDIDQFESQGKDKMGWINSEVRASYRDFGWGW